MQSLDITMKVTDSASGSAMGRGVDALADAALADAGFADDADDLGAASRGLGEGALEQLSSAATPDQRCSAQRRARVRPRDPRRRALQPEDADRGAHALDPPRAEVGEVEPALDEPRRRLGEVRRLRLGERLHTLGEPDGVAERCRIEAEVVLTDPADHDLARVEAEADMKLEAL